MNTVSLLKHWEWEFLLNLIYRLNSLDEIKQFQRVCLEQLRVIIPYTKSLFLLDDRVDDRIAPHTPELLSTDNSIFDETTFNELMSSRTCQEYYFSHWSQIFRRSDVSSSGEWEKSPIYQKIYAPQNVYYALKAILIYDDHLLGDISLYRPKDDGDFSIRDMQIVSLLKEHLALRLYQLRQRAAAHNAPARASRRTDYGFTRREGEVIALLHEGKTDRDICDQLCISSYTLKNYIHNIYRKTGAKTRIQIFLMTKDEQR
ncbi:MAG: response regulator transcription factor [Clostridia bacterium]|nr:response regulator transcription factor [Clostridia bacterium]